MERLALWGWAQSFDVQAGELPPVLRTLYIGGYTTGLQPGGLPASVLWLSIDFWGTHLLPIALPNSLIELQLQDSTITPSSRACFPRLCAG